MRSALLAFVFLGVPMCHVQAHEVRPAYLQLREKSEHTFEVLWKVPARGEDLRLGIYVDLPARCTNATPPHARLVDGAFSERWTAMCPGGLSGESIHISGLSATMTDVLLRLESLDGGTQVARLTPASPSILLAAEPDAMEVAVTYLTLGVEHILLGIDHLLFVLALLILVKGTRRLVATITAFTLAHSLTLACAALGWVHVSGPPVEACIALSIVFVAAEIVHGARGHSGITTKRPWVVAFTFGLLHGLGFAGALSEIGLPESAIPLSLLFFNVGVELGQLAFVAAAITIIGLMKGRIVGWPEWLAPYPAYAIGGCAAFWVIQRALST